MLYQSGEHNLTQWWVSVGSIELMGMINYFFGWYSMPMLCWLNLRPEQPGGYHHPSEKGG